MSAGPGQAWGNWANPSPIVKQLSALVAFAVAALLTITLPGLGLAHPEWFLAGTIVVLVATAVAAIISVSKSLWHLESIVAALSFIAIGLMRLGTDSESGPLVVLTVIPVLIFAGGVGRGRLVISALGSLMVLVLPVLLDHVHEKPAELWTAIFAALVFATVGFVTYVTTNAYRTMLRKQESLLEKSVEHTRQLEQSELERGAAERMLRGVWDAVTEQGIIGTDLAGRVDAWNPGAEKMLGLSATATEHKRDIVDFHARDELDDLARQLGSLEVGSALDPGFAALVESARHGIPETREWTYVRDDGSRLPVQLTVTPRLDEMGSTVGYLFVTHDMEEAREVAKLKDDFVGLISHELRTPLSSILGYLELMRDEDEDALSATQLQYLGVAERNAHRLLRLVGDLLFTAQVESGSFQLDAKEIDLSLILSASAESARPTAAAAGVTVAGDFGHEVVVEGDPLRLSQAIDNLVSNAVKFTPRGGTVTISLATTDGSAVITVRDTGLGIAEADIDRLFSRFFRATTATVNAVPGVGLGLAITKAIVTAHQGRMAVESEEGVGTTFSITLPLAVIASAVDA